MEKDSILAKYKDVIVGRNSANKEIFYDRLIQEDGLKEFLYNMYDSQDESLTGDGLKFLEKYYGLDVIAEKVLLEKKRGTNYHFTNQEEVIEWLKKFQDLH